MKKQKIFVVFFSIILIVPCLCTTLSSFSGRKLDIKLSGNFDKIEKPKFDINNFNSTMFQTDYNSWFHNNFAPRGLYIKIYNQLRYSLFHENGGGGVVVGKNNYIFQPSYIREHFSIGEQYDFSLEENTNTMADYVNKLSVISDELRKRNKYLIVYTATSKADYFYEELPFKYKAQAEPHRITASECFNSYMESHSNIIYLDCEKFINKLNLEYPIYYKSGIHWSLPVQQQVSKELRRIIREQCGLDVETYEFTGIQSQNEPFGRDADVLNLANIFQRTNETYYKYDVEVTLSSTPVNILIQGDSFTSFDNLDHNGTFSRIFNNVLFIPDGGEKIQLKEDFSILNLPNLVNENDVFIIGCTKPNLVNYSFGFVDVLYEYLIDPEEYVKPSATKALGLDKNKEVDVNFRNGNVQPLADYVYANLFNYDNNLSDSEFIQKCYTTIWNRKGSNKELEEWVNKIGEGITTRQDTLFAFLRSSEFSNRVNPVEEGK